MIMIGPVYTSRYILWYGVNITRMSATFNFTKYIIITPIVLLPVKIHRLYLDTNNKTKNTTNCVAKHIHRIFFRINRPNYSQHEKIVISWILLIGKHCHWQLHLFIEITPSNYCENHVTQFRLNLRAWFFADIQFQTHDPGRKKRILSNKVSRQVFLDHILASGLIWFSIIRMSTYSRQPHFCVCMFSFVYNSLCWFSYLT